MQTTFALRGAPRQRVRFVFASALAASLSIAALGATESTALAQPSAGDIAEARDLYNQGLRLRDKGDLAGAVDKLRAANDLASTPITGLELGRAYAATGKLVEARETFLSVGRLPVSRQESPRSAAARKDAAQLAEQLRARIPTLAVSVQGAGSDSVTVTIDGNGVPTEALLAPRPVDPGAHDVVATSANGGKATAHVEVKEGDSPTVQLTLTGGAPPAATPSAASTQPKEAPPPGPASPPPFAPPPSSSGIRPVLIFGGFGLAAAGAIVGGITGGLAMSKASSVKNACSGLTCPTSVDGDLSSGRTMGTVSTVAFIAAGVGAAVGVVGLVLAPPAHEEGAPPTAWLTPWVGPGAAGMSGAVRF